MDLNLAEEKRTWKYQLDELDVQIKWSETEIVRLKERMTELDDEIAGMTNVTLLKKQNTKLIRDHVISKKRIFTSRI